MSKRRQRNLACPQRINLPAESELCGAAARSAFFRKGTTLQFALSLLPWTVRVPVKVSVTWRENQLCAETSVEGTRSALRSPAERPISSVAELPFELSE